MHNSFYIFLYFLQKLFACLIFLGTLYLFSTNALLIIMIWFFAFFIRNIKKFLQRKITQFDKEI